MIYQDTVQEIKTIRERLDLCLSAGNLAWWEMDCDTGKVNFNENKVTLLGYSKEEFADVTYEAFTNLLHPDDYEPTMQAMRDHLSGKTPIYEIEYRIKTKQGNYIWFYDRGSIIQHDNEGNPKIIKGVVFDITDRKMYEEELKKAQIDLEKKVRNRTKELKEINIKLEEEIKDRKIAEEYTRRTKEYLKNVIDSASEIIMTFDTNNRVATWNRTAEYITGYKNIEVLNRGIKKLDVFDDKNSIEELIKETCKTYDDLTEDIILLTKQNQKKIIRILSSPIHGANKECIGTIFIGRDITRDMELHGKLVPGCNYLVLDSEVSSSINLLVDLALKDYEPFFITRSAPSYLKSIIPHSSNILVLLLSEKSYDEFDTISNLEELYQYINKICQEKQKSVILLDGIHYLSTLFNFDHFLKIMFKINDVIASTGSILFLRVDSSIITPAQLAVLKNEFVNLPSQNIDDLIIDDFLYDIIKYISQENMRSAKVSIKKMTKKFNITYPTAKKKLKKLLDTQLIYSKKEGKVKNLYISEKGKTLLSRRKSV